MSYVRELSANGDQSSTVGALCRIDSAYRRNGVMVRLPDLLNCWYRISLGGWPKTQPVVKTESV